MTVEAFRPLGKEDVAEILGVSIRTIDNYVAAGSMPAPAHIGTRAFWHPDIFYTWLDQALRGGGCVAPDEGVTCCTSEFPGARASSPGKQSQRQTRNEKSRRQSTLDVRMAGLLAKDLAAHRAQHQSSAFAAQ
ncbi:helix-turn-helix transcriptional regulator [Paraburkholderia adhaesiva]|uniref:helix-turn-helix transcriptional regulator n=1 Tax=Paraburkholderia adhaesiva TaxID=2883244 RepID=UPI001F21A9E6|nr:helix-turn-helix domain-containing protein [Paraburkholderia adhaesiva]